jgi:endonuclease-3
VAAVARRSAPPPLQGQLALLAELYPEVTTALDFTGPFELLVATVLAAQCTDARVNQVTPQLFLRWPTPEAMATATPADLEEVLASLPLFRSKARHLAGLSARLTALHDGSVPADLVALVALPGVGRKTAQVVLAYAFGIPGVVVDTHCGRLARRLGWTAQTDPVKVEHDLRALLSQDQWIDVPQRLVYHGRAVCTSRAPRCGECPLRELCPYAEPAPGSPVS